jgi:hypothetical protein
MSAKIVKLESYSEKAVVIRGEDALHYFSVFNRLGGKWNENLKDSRGESSPGFIFPKTKSKDLTEIISRINKGELKSTNNSYVKLSDHLALLKRLDDLEKRLRSQRVDKLLADLPTADSIEEEPTECDD